MKRQPVRYAVIRLQPHIETEEFANVGVVLVAPEAGYLDFRLETQRIGRYAAFFPQAGITILSSALQHAARELKRIRDLAEREPGSHAEQLFASLTKNREGVIRYSDVRHAIHSHPYRMIDDLFDRYVLRSMVDHRTNLVADLGAT